MKKLVLPDRKPSPEVPAMKNPPVVLMESISERERATRHRQERRETVMAFVRAGLWGLLLILALIIFLWT